MDPVDFWYFTLVASGVEHIRVLRKGSILYDGVMPAPFGMHLTVGDSVLFRVGNRKRWRCKFRLVMHNGKPYIMFGKNYGNIPHQYRVLSARSLDPRRLRNAGLLARGNVKKSH
jgi:hypothetical protein